jgi:hypothetical protein
MAIVLSGNPPSGAADEGIPFDLSAAAPDNTLHGLGGNDIMLAGFDNFYLNAGSCECRVT